MVGFLFLLLPLRMNLEGPPVPPVTPTGDLFRGRKRRRTFRHRI